MATLYAKDGSPVDVPEDQIAEALANGLAPIKGQSFAFRSPEGKIGHVDAENLAGFLSSVKGYTPISEQEASHAANVEKYGGALGQVEAGAEGLARGGTLGASDVALKALGVSPERLKGVADANPGTATVTELTGAIAPTLATEGAAVPAEAGALARAGSLLRGAGAPVRATARLGNTVEVAAARAAEKYLGKGIASRVAAQAARGAVEAPIYQIGHNISEDVLDDKELTASHAIHGMGWAALAGAGMGAGIETALGVTGHYLPKAADSAAEWLTRLEKRAGSPAPLDSSEQIRAAAANLGRADDHGKAVLKNFYNEVKPEIVERALAGQAANEDAAGILLAMRKRIGKADLGSPISSEADRLIAQAEKKFEAIDASRGDLAEQFNALDSLDRKINAIREPKGPLVTAKDVLAFGKLDEARSLLKRALRDEDVFGDAARLHDAANAVIAPFLQARTEARRKLFEKFNGEAVASPQKMAGFVGQEARNSPLADLRKQALRQYVDSFRGMLDGLNAAAYEKLGRQPVDLEKIAEHIGQVHNAVDEAVAAKKAELMGGTIKGDKVLGWTHVPGVPSVLPEVVARGVKHAALGAAGAALGIGHAIHFAGPAAEAVGGLIRVARGGQSETVAKVARVAAKGAERFSAAVRDFLGGRRPTLHAEPPDLKTIVLSTPAKRGENRVTAFERVGSDLRDLAANPAAGASVVGDRLGALSRHAPQTAGALAATISKAATYLIVNLPQSKTDPFQRKSYPPSDAELSRFERLARSAFFPLSTLADMHDGTLTRAQVDAFKTVHPALYGQTVDRLVREAAEQGKPLSFSQLKALSTFAGRPLAPGVDNVARTQAQFAQSNPPSTGKPKSVKTGKTPKIASLLSTKLQSATGKR